MAKFKYVGASHVIPECIIDEQNPEWFYDGKEWGGPNGDRYRLVFSDKAGEGYAGYALRVVAELPPEASPVPGPCDSAPCRIEAMAALEDLPDVPVKPTEVYCVQLTDGTLQRFDSGDYTVSVDGQGRLWIIDQATKRLPTIFAHGAWDWAGVLTE
jgi:hypothetical protein